MPMQLRSRKVPTGVDDVAVRMRRTITEPVAETTEDMTRSKDSGTATGGAGDSTAS